ncbi:hypothetical protein, partial [Frigoribacterium sp. 9N]|uniref:hypothetical protein n=1 Tax=Frigoribacterium sp. 9N TaxID=2653144 RepID=UPI001F2DE4B5
MRGARFVGNSCTLPDTRPDSPAGERHRSTSQELPTRTAPVGNSCTLTDTGPDSPAGEPHRSTSQELPTRTAPVGNSWLVLRWGSPAGE